MALGTALVDKGRIHRRSVSVDVDDDPVIIDGEKQYSTATEGEWFRCRLFVGSSSEVQGDGRRKEVFRHQMMCGRKVDINRDDEVEIESKQLGTQKFRVDGEPKELRKRRTVIGYEVVLVRSE